MQRAPRSSSSNYSFIHRSLERAHCHLLKCMHKVFEAHPEDTIILDSKADKGRKIGIGLPFGRSIAPCPLPLVIITPWVAKLYKSYHCRWFRGRLVLNDLENRVGMALDDAILTDVLSSGSPLLTGRITLPCGGTHQVALGIPLPKSVPYVHRLPRDEAAIRDMGTPGPISLVKHPHILILSILKQGHAIIAPGEYPPGAHILATL
mmetsp:Transcript_63153/g.150575  ORF Transcript_63153/g.150575 Transcript_63153/m.150575 type:complete len:206 (+) Transcript_63153:277-894(+)